MRHLIWISLLLFSCKKETTAETPATSRENRKITYNNQTVDIIIEKPAAAAADVLMVFHGSVAFDRDLMTAANTTLDQFKNILDRKDMMIISVIYPQENVLLGDNIVVGEAALLWLKNKASQELGIQVKKIFLGGHSQGGYMVTRLNTLHATNGVIANAPGPLNLVYRCGLEETGTAQASSFCTRLKNTYGITTSNPAAYFNRSLLNFTKGFKSDIIFFQGLLDAPIQMYSWPVFKQEVQSCSTCQQVQIVEIPGGEHPALFEIPSARAPFNTFINSR
ncbi:MAG: hypothetical protein ACK5GV_02115 [Bacteroidota bacterium]|jgi:hypothetical protein